MLGHTLQGHIEPGFPTMMQIGQDGRTAYRSSRQFLTETVVVDRDQLCEKSENMFGRPIVALFIGTTTLRANPATRT